MNSEMSNVGYTLFKPTGVVHEFPHVDLEKQRVTATVVYKEKVYMTVIVDVKTNTVHVDGGVGGLGDLSIDQESYIDMFKQQATFFIKNKIAHPKEYYEQFLKES